MSLGKRELSAVLLAFGVIISIYMALLAGPISAQDNGNEGCDNPEEIETFSGTDDQITPDFEITGNTFQLSWDIVDLDDDPGFDSFTIRPIEQDGFQADDSVLVFDEGSGTEIVLAGPGTFFLEIESEGFDYIVTVEDCDGGDDDDGDDNGEFTIGDDDGDDNNRIIIGGDDDDGDDNGEFTIGDDDGDDDKRIEIDKPNNREPTVINIPQKPLPPTGGLPVYGMIAGSILAGAGLFGLGLSVRRGQRR